jgi:hypothetical protein
MTYNPLNRLNNTIDRYSNLLYEVKECIAKRENLSVMFLSELKYIIVNDVKLNISNENIVKFLRAGYKALPLIDNFPIIQKDIKNIKKSIIEKENYLKMALETNVEDRNTLAIELCVSDVYILQDKVKFLITKLEQYRKPYDTVFTLIAEIIKPSLECVIHELQNELEDIKIHLTIEEFNTYLEVVENIPDNEICCICQEECNIQEEKIVKIKKCGHIGHQKCFREYFLKKCIKPVCPVCRTNLKETDL